MTGGHEVGGSSPLAPIFVTLWLTGYCCGGLCLLGCMVRFELLSYMAMRIPVTKYGLPQVAVFPAMVVLLMAVIALLPVGVWLICIIEFLLTCVFFWSLSFFRDPHRKIPQQEGILVSPADGTVTEITTIEHEDFIDGPALKIGIFLSVFNVHINRAPCEAKVEDVVYKKGRFLNAMSPESGIENESNSLHLVRAGNPADRVIVRQISGAIARRIVCKAGIGKKLLIGEKFGMIKFGSRTELYLPARPEIEAAVKIGDKVKAGVTVVVRYRDSDS